MLVRWITGFLDTPSRVAEPFWLAVTGTRLSARRDGGVFATLLPADGDAYLRVQEIEAGPARAHLDLHVADVPAAAGEAVTLGARVVRDDGDLVVMRSPAGIVFCLAPWHGERVRPAGQASEVDQLCLDIPAGEYDVEAGFWAALTGLAVARVGSAGVPGAAERPGTAVAPAVAAPRGRTCGRTPGFCLSWGGCRGRAACRAGGRGGAAGARGLDDAA